MTVLDSNLFEVDDMQGVYADGFVTDEAAHLLFGSFWGRDTAIQGLLARLSLPTSEGGLYRLKLVDCDSQSSRELVIGDADRLAKLTGRMPKANLFGDVVQLWLYDNQVLSPDLGARRALRLLPAEVDDFNAALDGTLAGVSVWDLVKAVCHLPLLDAWRQDVLDLARAQGWLKFYTGVGVNALAVDLDSDQLEAQIEERLLSGRLPLPQELVAGVPSAAPVQMEAQGGRLSSGQLEQALRGFTGTEHWFRHAFVRAMTYTDGVRFFAEQGGAQGAYWFLDIVATEYFPHLQRHPFQVVEVEVNDSHAAIRVEDGNGQALFARDIEYTDLQTGRWRFYLTDNVLLLPSEY